MRSITYGDGSDQFNANAVYGAIFTYHVSVSNNHLIAEYKNKWSNSYIPG